jgi:hypothetical protein
MPPEALLIMATFIARNLVVPGYLVSMGRYGPVLWEASMAVDVILRQQTKFQGISVLDLLTGWLGIND